MKTFVTDIFNKLNTEIPPQNGGNTEGYLYRNLNESNRLKIINFLYLAIEPCHVFEKVS